MKVEKFTITFIFLSLLTACGGNSDVENAIKARLRDPDSAKFQKVLVSKDQTRACAIWNAKNSFGGYGDWEIWRLKKIDGRWKEFNRKGDPEYCTVEYFKLRDELLRSYEKAEKGVDGSDPRDVHLRQLMEGAKDWDWVPPNRLKKLIELSNELIRADIALKRHSSK